MIHARAALGVSARSFARGVRTLALQLDDWVQGPEAGGFRCAPQAARDQVRSRFLNRTALAADHKDDRLAFSMKMIASEIGRAGGQPMDASCLLQKFKGTICLNRLHLAPELARKIIAALNAEARIIDADYGRVPLGAVLNTGLFDFERAQTHPLWFKELNGFKEHVPETEEYGIRSFVYRARRPFAPMAFDAFINKPWPGVVRAKGFFWLATRPNFVGELAQAGALVRTSKRGLWWSAVPRERWPDDPEWHESMKPYVDSTWGDRRQEIVFIGLADQMDEKAIRTELDAALTGTVDTFSPDAWCHLPDPFPRWDRQEA